MKVATAKQMRALDRIAMEKFGISSLRLMEKAGEGIANQFTVGADSTKGPILFLLGKGNNAGDAMVVARWLAQKKFETHCVLLWEPAEFSPDAHHQWVNLPESLRERAIWLRSLADLKNREGLLKRAQWIVDGILGTGFSGEVEGILKEAIVYLNSLNLPVAAIDVPSGLSADKGIPMKVALQCKRTWTLGLPKLGLVIPPGDGFCGQIEVIDIGLPAEALSQVSLAHHLLEPQEFRHALVPRRPDTHKGDYGHVLVIAGSRGMLGAGFLTAMGALRSGCGLATYAVAQASFEKFDSRHPEVIVEPLPDAGKCYLNRTSLGALKEKVGGKKAVAIGPGIGREPETWEVIREFLSWLSIPAVVDADAIWALADHWEVLQNRSATSILTPHPGEIARLSGWSVEEVQDKRIQIAVEMAQALKSIVVLKGWKTVVATANGEIFINPTGNPGMATAGMGDLLSGMIAGFLAQGVSPREAVLAAVYLHGLAGDMARESLGEKGLVTSDLFPFIPQAIRLVEMR